MDDIKRIPVPPAQRWREFRISYLPIVVFALAVAAIIVLWRLVVVPVGLTGEVATLQYQVRGLADGTLDQLLVEPFTPVKKGDVIGLIIPAAATNLPVDISVEVANYELDRLRTGMNVNRNLLELSTLELQRQKVFADLQIAKSDLTIRKSEYERDKELLAKNLKSKELFDITASQFEQAKTMVSQLTLQLEGYESQLKSFKEGQTLLEMRGQSDAVDKAIQSKTNAMRFAARPIQLVAPADGVVSSIGFRAGETVRAGESIATITSTNSSYIVGYIRQPISRMPQVNDTIQVRTRTVPRAVAAAKVLKVGGVYSFMNPAMITPDNNRHEKAIAFMVSIPSGVALHPGEFVDLSLGN